MNTTDVIERLAALDVLQQGSVFSTIRQAITESLDNRLGELSEGYLCDLSYACEMMEILYDLGYKKEARSYRKEFKDFVKMTEESREDIKYALDELKQINFGGAA